MSLICRNCSRLNPSEAQYCYWDGSALDGQGRASGPIAVAAQPFHSPFVFPSGRQCRSFDELVSACYSEWREALEVLREGYLGGFFGALGRTDLALAAKHATNAADADRGLDQLLSKLPCSNRQPAKMLVQPMDVNLGQMMHGSDRHFVLHIENQGMGLLQGTIASDDTAWLMLGEGAGSPRKVFQCLHEFRLPVRVHGKALRAGNKPLQGRLSIESSGGDAMVVVRVDVPVQPFPEGVLAGAISPRQVAERSKVNPKAAAPYFEKGAVADWYQSNGWIYPVQGPASSGLGAIQQFFEALGLTKAPVVEISTKAIHLQGPPGANLEHVLQVRAQERRPVFAYATTAAPWLQIGHIRLDGRTAHVPVQVASVPAQPGEEMRGKVQVTANGGQRFIVEVTLTITGRISAHVDRLPVGAALDPAQILPPVAVLTTADVVSAVETTVETVAHPGREEIPEVLPAAEVDGQHGQHKRSRDDEFEDKAARIGERTRSGCLMHLLSFGVLALMLLSVVVHDLWVIFSQPAAKSDVADTGLLDPNPRLFIHFHDYEGDKIIPRPTMRFGLSAKDSDNPDQPKRLIFDEHGRTNNTVVRLDGMDHIFGEDERGQWLEMKGKLQGETAGRPRNGLASSWFLPHGQLKVTQEVEIVPGVQSRLLDTCLVRYILENRDNKPHRVGIRFMLDTFIGANDHVPFTIPGASDLCDTKMMFATPERVPDFIQALEKDDLRNPGTVAYLQLRIDKNVESPSRVMLGGWPNSELRKYGVADAHAQNTGWNVPFISIKERITVVDKRTKRKTSYSADDSAVTMYWNERPLGPGQTRVVGFTYGLGSVDARESGGHLLLTVGGRLVPNVDFSLTALVNNPGLGETLTLELPAGVQAEGQQMEQQVPAVPAGARQANSPVTWRLRASQDGKYELSVRSSTGAKQKLSLTVRTRGVFD